jgi:hypothetical protein
MHLMNKNIYFLIIPIAIIFASCTTLSNIEHLKIGKQLSTEETILLFQVEVIDHTGKLEENRYSFLPRLNIKKLDDYKIVDYIDISSAIKTNFWTGDLQKPGWINNGDSSVYKEVYYTSAEPGEYHLDNISLYLGSTNSSSYNSSTTTSYTQYFYQEKGFKLKSNTFNVLGVIKLEILNIEGQFPNYVFTSNSVLDNSEAAVNKLLADFTVTYHDTVGLDKIETFVVSPYSIYVEDFILDNYFGNKNWNNYQSEAIDYFVYNDKYVLKKKIEDDSYHYMKCNRTFNLISDFDLTWECSLVNGNTEETYGLMLGSNPENCYFFYLNGSGTSGIAQLKKNNWQENPTPHSEKIDENDMYNIRQHRLVGNVDKIKYYIDGNLIGETGSGFKAGEQMLAFFISGKSTIEFDNLFVRAE